MLQFDDACGQAEYFEPAATADGIVPDDLRSVGYIVFLVLRKTKYQLLFVLGVQGFVLDGVMGGTALYPAIAFAERVPIKKGDAFRDNHLLQRAASQECAAPDGGYAVGDADVFEAFTKEESVALNRGYLSRNIHIAKRQTAHERLASQRVDRFGDDNLLDTLAGLKRPRTNDFRTLLHLEDLLLGETIELGLHVGRIERIAESLEKRTSALQLARGIYIFKDIDIKFFQAAWERDLMQAFAS